ncbi:non-ribosomal peptide synthetase [Saccharothrix australiensis]|uniref:Amino acid adenylation domain-containing protein n=1 Tax=Saccharothrix australiensis TaxID=2072 RepID=A0A495VYG0_9PSEU|nr:non-ribosomal peptide synthetase [Saccharothrix australiensis]RKT54244.1 amino acid adenylation domain-containing protein [Saccharothrix australiensis]
MTSTDLRPGDLTDRFRRVVRQFPDRVAVRAVDGALDFAALDHRSRRLAGALAAAGVGPGTRVGIHLGRTSRLVVALVAVWRAGGAYVPLDPSYPADRLAFMMADSGLVAVIADEPVPGRPDGVALVPVDPPTTTVAPLDVDRDPDDAAYVIYTSGTTGKPKGVQVGVGGVEQLVHALEADDVYPSEHRTVAWNASISFDASVQQWIRVLRGDTLVLLDDEARTEPEALVALLEDHAVTDIDFTPTHVLAVREHLDHLAERRVASGGSPLRLLVGGEAIPGALWEGLVARGLAGGLEAVNLYGPTECGVDATAAWIGGATPHIGTPLSGVKGYVLDERLRPTPPDEPGHLYLSGPGLAHGYVGRSALTAQRFVADPFDDGGARMYRTGDRVRERPDGTLEFLGRTDRQAKLRGFRIELDEVGHVLAEHPRVASAAVVLSGGRELVAYVTGSATEGEELRAWCATRLPPHMVPGRVAHLDRMPTTAGGKVDFADLEGRAPRSPAGPEARREGGGVEDLLCAVWGDILGLDAIDAEDNFFALGGHSLLAITVVSEVKKTFAVRIKTADVYRFPRLGDLAGHIRQVAAETARPAVPAS